MKPLGEFRNSNIKLLFTDIDDTLTDHGQLGASAYSALWNLKKSGIQVVPVTGRPAGWCEMIARFWPVEGVIGENGGFYFRYAERKMKRYFCIDEKTRIQNRQKLDLIAAEVLNSVPGSAIASDQFARTLDLAIDFCEDVAALSESDVDRIVKIFEKNGATAKVSSIHVNGWFGSYDKLSMCREFVSRELKMDLDRENESFAFSGDSPNDEPMFAFFKNSFAVANIRNFITRIQHHPAYIADSAGGNGFVEIADRLITSNR